MARSIVLLAVLLLCQSHSRDGIQLWAANAVSSSIEDKIEGAILGCLVADALTLGSSFENDAKKIKDAYFRERRKDYGGLRYHAPGDLFHGHHNYHKTRKDGDQTDHGDSNIYLLEYFSKLGVKKTLPFDISHYVKKYWIHIYKGHQKGECRACGARIDPAVKTFLENFEKGKSVEEASADSSAHVVRFAGALAVYHGDDEMLDRIAALTTEFTHGHHESEGAAVYWARVVHRVIDGMDPQAAVIDAAKSMNDNPFIVTKVNEAIDKVNEAIDPESALSKEDFCDDLAITSMGQKWTPGMEPLKLGKCKWVMNLNPRPSCGRGLVYSSFSSHAPSCHKH